MIKSKKIRISFMNMDEMLLTRAEGMATNGSINVDGSSSVRRTCQLNFVSNELKPVNYFELYKTKFLLEIDFGGGFKKQGIYLLTSFSTSISTNNYTFNISGKDKMCLLNGEHGGSFPFSIDVGTQEKIEYNFEPLVKFEYEPGKYYYQNKGEYILDYSPYGTSGETYYKRLMTSQKEKLTIKEIINNVVVVYGKEQKHNIFINDLEIKGLELLEYRGSDPLYLFRDVGSGKIVEITIDGDFNLRDGITPNTLPSNQFFSTSALKPVNYEPLEFQYSAPSGYCNIIRIQYGEPIGYRDTDLTYAGELTANINENVVSILDKIKNMLGNYEYFYDEEGRFIFQKRQDYVSNQFSSIGIDGLGMEYQQAPMTVASPIDLTKVASIGQNPQFQNIKNDFSIWGTRSGESGSLPIHSRIAIHQKPTEYTTYTGKTYQNSDDGSNQILSIVKLNKEEINGDINAAISDINEIYYKSFDPANTLSDNTLFVNFFNNFIQNLEVNVTTNSALESYSEYFGWIKIVEQIYQDLNQFFFTNKSNLIFLDSVEIILNNFIQCYLLEPFRLRDDLEHMSHLSFQNFIVENLTMKSTSGFKFNDEGTKKSLISLLERYSEMFYVYETVDTHMIVRKEISSLNLLNKNANGGIFQQEHPLIIQEADIIHSQLSSSIRQGGAMAGISAFFQLFGLQVWGDNNVYWSYNREALKFCVTASNLDMEQPNLGTLYFNPLKIEDVEQDVDRSYLLISFTRDDFMTKQKAIYNRIQRHGQDIKTSLSAIEAAYEVGDTILVTDWREVLYQMAKDYYDNGTQPDFWQKINEYNNNQYLSWKTGYEAFYEDILGFWRQLYFDPLYEPLDYELPIGYNLEDYIDYNGWHRDVFENPNGLNFWIDFIEPQGELSAYAIDKIGVKGKYENSSTVKSISIKQPPAVKVLTNMEWELLGEEPDPSYTYIQLEGVLANSYTQSAQGISALERTQNLLFNHTYLQESVTLSIIPDENLTVNSRIKLNLVNVQGEYTISKITLPLAYNGMMSVTLTKIPPTLTTEIIIKEFE